MTEAMTNKEYVLKYPFIEPRSAWTGERFPDYDYESTLLDNIPTGWKIRFGQQLCEDLKTALHGATDWQIIQIKEKFGTLRIYANYMTPEISEVIDKYEQLSSKTCVRCGAPATKYSTGWILPWCDRCGTDSPKYYTPIK